MINPCFWKGKKVFVTGHTGFKGGWLALWLKHLGADVTGYALEPSTVPSICVAAGVESEIRSVIGDVRDGEALAKAITEASPDLVIHMAAQPLVRYSYRHPVETYETNVMGTVHLLEAVRRTKSVRGVLIVTSDKCYENREREVGYTEDEAMGGFDPYSNSKGCAELVVSAYRQSFFDSGSGVAIATARAGNVIGGGDWSEDRLIPDMIRSFTHGDTVKIRQPFAIRPWQHVLEALHGYLILMERMWDYPAEYSEAWNFGPDDSGAKNVEWLVRHFAESWGEGAKWLVESDAEHLHEASILKLDCSKARERLGWRPVLSLNTSLDWISEWYRRYYAGESASHCSYEQIDKFQGLLG